MTTAPLSIATAGLLLMSDEEYRRDLERRMRPAWAEIPTIADLRALAFDGCEAPHRQEGVRRLAEYLFLRKVDPYIAWAILGLWAEVRCDPPLDPHEAERIIRETYRANKEVAHDRDSPVPA